MTYTVKEILERIDRKVDGVVAEQTSQRSEFGLLKQDVAGLRNEIQSANSNRKWMITTAIALGMLLLAASTIIVTVVLR